MADASICDEAAVSVLLPKSKALQQLVEVFTQEAKKPKMRDVFIISWTGKEGMDSSLYSLCQPVK
jgi:hypothetical protein